MIQFFAEEIDLPKFEQERYINWLVAIAEEHKFEIEQINYIFCSDDYLLKINQDYLNHDYYTDIITFPLKENPIASDIFISIDRVKDNAKKMGKAVDLELQRVMVHGLLHLVGYNDKDEESQQKMRAVEDDSIERLKLT